MLIDRWIFEMTDLQLAQMLGFADYPQRLSALAKLDHAECAKQEATSKWGCAAFQSQNRTRDRTQACRQPSQTGSPDVQ
jgi:hypothetical protein